MIEITVKERYETGLARTYGMGEVVFDWTDWVLCEIEWHKGNCRHWCLASSFRGEDARTLSCTIMNPSYDDMHSFVRVAGLHHFRPVKVIEEARQRP